MERGAISLDSVAGAVDVQATLESGQTYLWWRPDGDTYRTDGLSGGDAWYRTVVGDDVVDLVGPDEERGEDAFRVPRRFENLLDCGRTAGDVGCVLE